MTRTNRLRGAFLYSLIGVCGIALAGCDEFQEFDQYRARRDSVTPYAGDAVRHNMAVQTIDPWPRNSGDNQIGLDGHRALIAAERYRRNRVIEPRGLSSSSASGPIGGAGGAPPAPAR